MDYQNLKVEVTDGVAIVQVAREKVLNALDARTLDELADLAARLDGGEPSWKGVILTGAGEKAFVAGADIGALSDVKDGAHGKSMAERGQNVFRALERTTRPVIACVNGHCYGGGLELALACHFRYATKNAKLGLPEVKLGLIPGYGGTQRLPRAIGRGQALELILTGEPVNADDALRIGLVNKVFGTKDEMLVAARKTIDAIGQRGPLAVGLAIHAVDRGLDVSLDEGLAIEAGQFGLIAASGDAREGTKAFLEKRQAKFTAKPPSHAQVESG